MNEKAIMELLDALDECATFYKDIANMLLRASDKLKNRIARAKELSQQ